LEPAVPTTVKEKLFVPKLGPPSAAAAGETLGLFGGVALSRGAGGLTVVKSFVLSLESANPPFLRRMAVVLLLAGAPVAAALPSYAFPVPNPTKSMIELVPSGFEPVNAVVDATNASLPFDALMFMPPVESGRGSGFPAVPPEASCTR